MPALATSLAALSLLFAPVAQPAACPAPPADTATLVPDDATVIVGLDIDAFVKTTVGAALVPALRGDLAFAEALEIADDCGISLERTYAATLARDAADSRTMIVQGRGLGTPETLTCLADELAARDDGRAPWTSAPVGCLDARELSDGSTLFVINDFTLVWARGPWTQEIAGRLDGSLPAHLPRSREAELALVDRDRHLWLTAGLTAADRETLDRPWARETTALTASFDFSNAQLAATLTFASADVAALAALQQLMIAAFKRLDRQLEALGVITGLGEQTRLGIARDVVAVEFELSTTELVSLRERIGEHIVGRGPV